MSLVSTILDSFKGRVADLLPNHIELPNPYQVDSNPENFLDLGWAVAVGSGENSARQTGCSVSIQRTIQVTITRKFIATDIEKVKKFDAVKALLEDAWLVIEDFEYNNEVNGASRTSYNSDSGIVTVFDNRSDFIKIDLTFSCEYFENL
jgi:hypothetical protein